MNPMLKKLIDQDFMNEKAGNYLEEAIKNKDTIIISGHRGHGILPLLATLGATAKANGLKVKAVRNPETDLNTIDDDYLLIGDLKDADYNKILTYLFSNLSVPAITIKDAEHSFSIMKIVKDAFKINKDSSKKYQIIECTKINDIKQLAKIIQLTIDSTGKPLRENISF